MRSVPGLQPSPTSELPRTLETTRNRRTPRRRTFRRSFFHHTLVWFGEGPSVRRHACRRPKVSRLRKHPMGQSAASHPNESTAQWAMPATARSCLDLPGHSQPRGRHRPVPMGRLGKARLPTVTTALLGPDLRYGVSHCSLELLVASANENTPERGTPRGVFPAG
jgi:hypothetical protein